MTKRGAGDLGMKGGKTISGTLAGRSFRLFFRPRLSDTDATGVVHFSRFFVFFEQVEAQFYRDVGYDFTSQSRDGFYLARVNAECRFSSAIRTDDEVLGEMRVTEVGRTHLKYAFRLRNGSTGATSAEGSVVVVPVDTKTWKKVPISEKLLTVLEGSGIIRPRQTRRHPRR